MNEIINQTGFYFSTVLAVIFCTYFARTVLVGIIQIISEAFANFLTSKKGEDAGA